MTATLASTKSKLTMLAVAGVTLVALSLGIAAPAYAANGDFAQRAPQGAASAGRVLMSQAQGFEVFFQNMQLHDSDSDSAPMVLYSRIQGSRGMEPGWTNTARTTSRTWVNHRNVQRSLNPAYGTVVSVFVKTCEDNGNPNTGYNCSPWQQFTNPFIQ